jgi:hypothetical protein
MTTPGMRRVDPAQVPADLKEPAMDAGQPADSGPCLNRQVAPYPDELADLVGKLRYRRNLGWAVWLDDDLQRDKPGVHHGESRGLTLIVQRHGPDSYHPERTVTVHHYFAVPPATYNRESWLWWLCGRLGDVDAHERTEDYLFAPTAEVRPGEPLTRPYAPNHGPGWDPYLVTVERTEQDRRTSFRGVLDDDGTGRPKRL